MLHNLLYLEHKALILVFRVPQSVQKVKTAKFHKHLRNMEQKCSPSNYIIKASFNNIFASQNNYDELNYVQLQEI